jgi:hypothetical protein
MYRCAEAQFVGVNYFVRPLPLNLFLLHTVPVFVGILKTTLSVLTETGDIPLQPRK